MEDTIENLYTRKQYDEAEEKLSNLWQNKLMTLSSDELNKLFIGPMLAKTRNSKFNHLLLSGNIEGAREYMRITIGHDQNRDMHWLRKVM